MLSIEIINKFTSNLLVEGLAEKTIKDILIILQQILKYGNINIKIPMPKVSKNEIQILKKDEQSKLEKDLIKNLSERTFGI